MRRHDTVLRRDETVLLVVDFQDKLVGAMEGSDSVTAEIGRLAQGMQLLELPILVTEQYPQGLGHTVPELAAKLPQGQALAKTSFSCCGVDGFWDDLAATRRRQIIVTGIEAHVCVLQTALDLLANGYQVHVPQDAVTSRKLANYQNALQRLQQAGVIVTNTESVLFELMAKAGTPEFKALQKLIV